MNKGYFCLRCGLFDLSDLITQGISIKLKSLVLENENKEIIVISNRNVEYEFIDTTSDIIFDLYIENDNVKDRIDYLLDEDFEIIQLHLDITQHYDEDLPSLVECKYEILSILGQVNIDFNNKLLANLVYGENTEQGVGLIGHRPDRLYGYDLNDSRYKKLATDIAIECEELILNNNIKYFITGATLGAETVSFFAVEFLKKKYPNIKNIVAIPFKNVYVKWASVDKDRYHRMIDLADGVIEVDLLQDYKTPFVKDGEYHINKLSVKNDFIIDSVDNVIAVYDGLNKGNTSKTLSYAKYNNKNITLINIGKRKDDSDFLPF